MATEVAQPQPLSPEAIDALLAQQRDRGGHERFLRAELVAKGVSYVELRKFPKYKDAPESRFKQGLNNAAKKIEGLKIQIVDAGEPMGWIVVNLGVHTATLAEGSDDE